jgi:hypothetical protein
MGRGGIIKEKKNQNKKNKKSKTGGGMVSPDAPVFILPKVITKKKKDW